MSNLPANAGLEDIAQLVEYVRSLGATEAEIREAAAAHDIGPLALELSLRGDGPVQSLQEIAAASGVDVEVLKRIWLACGLPEDPGFPFPITSDAARALHFFAGFMELVGEEAVLGVARVLGMSAARLAEGVSAVVRVGVEAPQRSTGAPYSQVVRDYATRARDGVPELLDALGAMFRRHLVLVSYQTWSVDPAGAAVVVDQAVGFADMVGSTEEVASFDVRRLAEMVEAFERHSWDTVTGAGGRVVKLIGDEVMFVHADAGAACGIANELIEHSRHHVRVGIAHGSMVAMHGDFYGAVVNLAARLVAQAGPDEVIVSEAARQASPGRMFEPFDVGALKGFVLPTQAFRLVV